MNKGRSFRVGFWLGDASPEYGGIGPYALRVLTALLTEHEPEWHLVLLSNDGILPPQLETLVAERRDVIEIRLIPRAPQGWRRRLNQAQRVSARAAAIFKREEQLPRSLYLQNWLNGLALDLVHFPTQTMLHPALQSPYTLTMHCVQEPAALRLRMPYLVTMHDVQELHFPENFSPAQRAVRAVQYWKAMEKAAEVIVSYHHVRADLIKFFGLPADKIHVCPIPFNSISLAAPTPDEAAAYATKYADWTPFLFYPAHTWQHKNHAQLFRALRKIKDNGIDTRFENLSLICTGGTNHHYHAEVLREVKALALTDSILFAGIVPENELRWLYEQAALVTIPTRYEAGSFPLYEAMLLGAPVICSNVTSLPETINDARFIFDPQDTEALAALITRALSDEDFRQANRDNSALQSAELRRLNAAAYFYETYRSALRLPPSTNPT
jgi:glycosyltransferase involved in cell wall biosynthesis